MSQATEIIALKRDGKELSSQQIKWFITSYLSGDIADYQVSALLMAITINGMNRRETEDLTNAMLYSGKVIQFPDSPLYVDKHSTGGVGDKTSFLLAPIAAACGVKVPMMAGRGLGHTGGTVDKIESLSNFKIDYSLEEFKNKVMEEGICLIGQTKDIAPADKLIYALRDVTATVESIPLITASIMSKKLAEGAKSIVMDIKWGNGAFMQEVEKARELAGSLRLTAKQFNRSMMTCLSDMNSPLGNKIGNAIELQEIIECLEGAGPKDTVNLSIHLAAGMIHLAQITDSLDSAVELAQKALRNGQAMDCFKKWITNQGGDLNELYSPEALAPEKTQVFASQNGYIHQFDCKSLGKFITLLGGGRLKTTDQIDHKVGLLLHKKLGDPIKKGESLLTIYHHPHQSREVEEINSQVQDGAINISDQRPTSIPLILETKISY